jgi:hypothetical protein
MVDYSDARSVNKGHMHITGTNDTICTLVDTYYKMSGTFSNSLNKNFTTTAAGELIHTGPDNSIYQFDGVSDLAVNKASVITYGLFVNSTLVPGAETPHTFAAASKIANIAITEIITLNNGDSIDIHMKSDTASTTVTVNTLFIRCWGEE